MRVFLGILVLLVAVLAMGCERGIPTTPTSTATAPSAPVVIVANGAIEDRTIVVGASGQSDVLIGSYVIQSSCEKPPGVVSLEGSVYSNVAGGLSRLRLMRADKAPMRTSFSWDSLYIIGGTLEMGACETIQVDVVADILKEATDGVYYDNHYLASLRLSSPSIRDKMSGAIDNSSVVLGQALRVVERGTISASIESETTGGSSIKICALGEEGQVLRMDLSVKEERKEVRLLRTGLGSEPSGSPGAGIVSFSFLERRIMIPVFGCRNVGVNVPARELELLGLEARGKVSGLPLPLLRVE